jgi:hypothetical protein
MFFLIDSYHIALSIKDHKARAGGALINGSNILVILASVRETLI